MLFDSFISLSVFRTSFLLKNVNTYCPMYVHIVLSEIDPWYLELLYYIYSEVSKRNFVQQKIFIFRRLPNDLKTI